MTDSHSRSSTDVLMHLIVALLAPMFVQAAGGDMDFARAAAAGTVNDYRARNHIDLLAIAQIIGFGLTALGLLGLSMADDITTSTILRLRASAVASNRASEACRRALAKSRPDREPASINGANDPSFDASIRVPKLAAPQEGDTKTSNTQSCPIQSANIRSTGTQAINPAATDIIIKTADAQTADAQTTAAQPVAAQPVAAQPANAQPANAQPAAQSASVQSSGTQATTGTANFQSVRTQPPKALAQAIAPVLQSGTVSSGEENRSFWANAMSSVAANVTASLPQLPPAERHAASIRANALSSVARDLLTGNKTQPRPPFALPR